MSKYIKVIARIFISAVFIYILLRQVDIESTKSAIQSYKFYIIPLGLLLSLMGTLVSSIRLKLILKTSGYNLKVKELFVLYLKGYFYNNFLPTQLGGDAYKSIALGAHIKDQSTSLFAVFMDRLGGLLVLLVMALIGIGSIYKAKGLGIAFGVLMIGALLYFPVLKILSKKIKFFRKFKQANDMFLKDKKSGVKVLVYSAIVQVFSFSVTYLLFWGAGVVLSLTSVIAYMPFTSLSLLIPTFNGFGSQEFVYVKLFAGEGVTSDLAIAASIMQHATRLMMSLLGGVLIMLGIGFKDEKKVDMVVEEAIKNENS